jgi:hypothetical protein
MLKKLKTRNVYQASNVRFDADKIEAFSYDWWKFVKVENGQTVFNEYPYSPTTRRHQTKVRVLMDKLGIKITKTVNQRASL